MSHDPRLWNEDLAPVTPEKRTWGVMNIASLWIGMAVCVPTYLLASGLILQGMNWRQALVTITLGNLLVLIPMLLNSHPGTKYGIPFPVLLRSSFGTRGANIAALMRALVACGWFGIQTWVGGSAIYALHVVIFEFTPATVADQLPVIGLSPGQLGCFLMFWALNMIIIIMGIDTIKWLEILAAPFLIIAGLVLLYWGVSNAGGFGIIFSPDTVAQVRGEGADEFNFWAAFFPSLTAMVGFWATLSLNIPDFTRYAKSQSRQMLGQAIGLPTTMALFAFISIAVTLSTVVIFGEAIWDPVKLLERFDSKVVIGMSLFCLSVATLSTNIAANVVSPANDFSNLAPRLISFRTGGIITGFIGILIFPWKLMADPSGYIFTWLIGYSALLGSIGGVMICDYWLLRRTKLDIEALYQSGGEFQFSAGFNWRALIALFAGIAVNVPGFLQAASGGAIQVPDIFNTLYTYACFVSFGIAGNIHIVLNAVFPKDGRALYPPSE